MVTLVNRAKMSTATTGTGTITLGSAVAGFQSFAAAGVLDGDVVRYVIEDGTDFEIGTGTFGSAGGTLTRTVSESSNADAALNLTGDAVVYVSATAADIPPVLELYAENPSSPVAPSATGTNAVAIGSGTTASGLGSLAAGSNSSGLGSKALTGAGAMALGGSHASGADSFAVAVSSNSSFFGAKSANSVAIGRNARAEGTSAFCFGSAGTSNVAEGNNTFVTGLGCTASGNHSVVFGNRGNDNGVQFRRVFGSDTGLQSSTFVLRSDTTNATPEALTTNNLTPTTTNQIILPNNSAYAFHGTIVARQQASQGTACAAFKIEGLIRREGNAASTVLVNSATTVLDNTPGFGMTLSADTVNGGLKIEVTGLAATNIRFVATVHTSEVTF